MLFVDRAFYSLKVGRSDRAGFLDLGAAALERDFDPDPPINTYPPPFAVVMRPSRRRSTRWDLRYIAGFGALRSCWRWPFSPVILRRRSS